MEAFEEIVQQLLTATDASRTTLRLDWPERGLHVNDVAAEALKPGVSSLRGQTSIDQRRAETVRWLERERRPLIQQNCLEADTAPPRELIQLYGVRAQMLGPIVRDGHVVGWLSVHENRGLRRWSRGDAAVLLRAMAAIDDILGQHEPGCQRRTRR